MTTKEALLKSIKKWEDICFEGGSDWGGTNCALCEEYAEDNCIHCPVNIVTDNNDCSGSPYDDWGRKSRNTVCVKDENDFNLALQEYMFLCMLYWEYYA